MIFHSIMSENKQSQLNNTPGNGELNNDTKANIAAAKMKADILNCVARSKAIFKSQQKDDPDLTFEEKRTIAETVFNKSECLFLSKFGFYLKKDHLLYFNKTKDEDYELFYHVNKLQRHFDKSTRQIDIKNRRYEALKKLIEKGNYFSECEMMKRNPLLYEHLVGRYMTDEEKRARDNADMKDVTFLNILLEGIERDEIGECQKKQQEEEDNTFEESDSDDSTNDKEYKIMNDNMKQIQWGEVNGRSDDTKKKLNSIQRGDILHEISSKEKEILKQEFVTNMYQSFLDGKDVDFDYGSVDNNDTYDNIELRTQDEEEKYFDSESPETVLPHRDSISQSESEDELEVYMKSLKGQDVLVQHSMDSRL